MTTRSAARRLALPLGITVPVTAGAVLAAAALAGPGVAGAATPLASASASASATPKASATTAKPTASPTHPATAPSAPAIVSVTAGDTTATVTLSAPKSSGGSAVLGYIVTAVANGHSTVNTSSASSPVTVHGLADGITFTFTAKAYNAVGESPASAPVKATPVVGPVTLTLSGGASHVHLGAKVTYTGELRRGLNGVPDLPLTISETYTDGKVVGLGRATTNASGAYSFTTSPLYNGSISVSGLGAKASVASRVIVALSTPRVSRSGGEVTVKVSSAPGFITSPSRQERAQLVEVDGAGHIVKVLATVDAAQRTRAHGYAHGVNVITATAAAPAGARLAVRVLGTPVNAGATSRSVAV